MRLTLPEPKIELYVDGFDGHDKLGRIQTGETLSELVENVQDPLVIALDGAWGSGKSFFLKCWVGEHLKRTDNTTQTIYFDAFAHDFLDDPLIALTGVIAERLEENGGKPAKSAWRKARQVAPALARAVLRVGVSMGTAGIVTNAGDIIDAATDTISNELQEVVADFWKKEEGKRAAMGAFRNALVELTAPDDDKKPTQKIIVVVDELDRCRPDYALSLLEIIKHFFNVDGVHFVLGVNLKELQNSVRARYGSGVNASRYLQKFIIASMTLPTKGNFSGRGSVVAEHFNRTAKKLGIQDIGMITVIANLLEKIAPPSVGLRDAERIATSCVISKAVNSYRTSQGYLILLGMLLVLKTCDPKIFSSIVQGTTTFSELRGFFQLPETTSDETDRVTKAHWTVLAYCFPSVPGDPEPSETLVPTGDAIENETPRENYMQLIARYHLMEITLQRD